MTFFVRAGLYAEGPSDYAFLLPLLDRLLQGLLTRHFPAQHILEDSLGLPDIPGRGRDRRIAAAIVEHWTTFTLFVIHSDSDGDARAAHTHTIAPAIALAREQAASAGRKGPLVAVPCIPVRELEAWLLTDLAVFERLGLRDAQLPPHPDCVTDPKQPLAALLRPIDRHRDPPFEFFGDQIALESLRRLAAFREFEHELLQALHLLARPGGRA